MLAGHLGSVGKGIREPAEYLKLALWLFSRRPAQGNLAVTGFDAHDLRSHGSRVGPADRDGSAGLRLNAGANGINGRDQKLIRRVVGQAGHHLVIVSAVERGGCQRLAIGVRSNDIAGYVLRPVVLWDRPREPGGAVAGCNDLDSGRRTRSRIARAAHGAMALGIGGRANGAWQPGIAVQTVFALGAKCAGIAVIGPDAMLIGRIGPIAAAAPVAAWRTQAMRPRTAPPSTCRLADHTKAGRTSVNRIGSDAIDGNESVGLV